MCCNNMFPDEAMGGLRVIQTAGRLSGSAVRFFG
jgi:hypothetical protein